MDVSLELNNLNCQIEKHDNGDIVGFCIDDNCKEVNKFCCLNCFFDTHSQHKVVKLKELNTFIQGRYKIYKKTVEEEKEVFDAYKNNELMNAEKIQKFKKEMFEQIEKKVKTFLEELSNKYMNLNEKKIQDFTILKEYEDFFIGNAAPIQKIDLNKLSGICTNIYKVSLNNPTSSPLSNSDSEAASLSVNMKPMLNPVNTNTINPNNENQEKKNKLKKAINEINKEFDDYVKRQKTFFNNYLNSQFLNDELNFLSASSKFEWCRKTYNQHNFYYQLEKQNMKGTKISSNGTMTVLRAKEKLQNNYKYKIKFLVGMNYIGDFDLGIGTEKAADSCWLRNKESICISNTGILNLDINYDNSIKLKDNDIVEFEIITLDNRKSFKGSINDKLVFDLDFNLEDVFIMAAIRNTGNYIEVLEYDSSPL